MVGTSINIFIKNDNHNDELAEVYYSDLYGMRSDKYSFLSNNSINSVPFERVNLASPHFMFVPKDYTSQNDYEKGFKVDELFSAQSMGITTGHDRELISLFPFNVGTNQPYSYRPFDNRFINYDSMLIVRPREAVMSHLKNKNNIALALIKVNSSSDGLFKVFITNGLTDKTLLSSKDNVNVFPLFLYDSEGKKQPNLKDEILTKINGHIGKKPSPEVLLGYIYGVLFSTAYRDKYKDFLKVDFPRIPYPSDAEQFDNIAEKGNQLIDLHLMKGAEHWPINVTFPVIGDNIIEDLNWSEGGGGRVMINKTQYLGNVSALAWNTYIGGYQPAQKWLKDRKGHFIDFQDIIHYNQIIYALEQTERIMKEIDEIGFV